MSATTPAPATLVMSNVGTVLSVVVVDTCVSVVLSVTVVIWVTVHVTVTYPWTGASATSASSLLVENFMSVIQSG